MDSPKSTPPSKPKSGPYFSILSISDGLFDDGYFQQTEESSRFRQEYEMRKMKQDQGFDMIAEGLDTLKNMAHDMNEFRSSRNFCIDIVLLIIILGIAAYLYNVLKKDTS